MTEVIQTCLFLGGPWDGQRMPVEDRMREVILRQPVQVKMHELSKKFKMDTIPVKNHIYRREIVAWTGKDGQNTKKFEVMLHQSVHLDDVLEMLLYGYRATKINIEEA